MGGGGKPSRLYAVSVAMEALHLSVSGQIDLGSPLFLSFFFFLSFLIQNDSF